MTYYVRDIKEGQRFVLLRSGEIYTKLAITTQYGHACHNVLRKGAKEPSSLAHSCVVSPIFKYSEIQQAAIAYKRRENAKRLLRELKDAYEVAQL